ncbi:MAG: DUF1284 domain-containing protein [Pleomorphochaeta sp.]
MINIRIHHFFDIIRDYGSGKIIQPHPYGHSLHLISQKITSGEIKEMRLVIECDAICENCNKLFDNHCIDTISHRKDFKSKEQFNNYLDNRIMETLGLKKGQTITCAELINLSTLYLDNIDYIYLGNDTEHTKNRAANVKKGISLMKAKRI